MKGDLLTGTKSMSTRILPENVSDNILKQKTICDEVTEEEKKEKGKKKEKELPKLSYETIYAMMLKKSSSSIKWIFNTNHPTPP